MGISGPHLGKGSIPKQVTQEHSALSHRASSQQLDLALEPQYASHCVLSSEGVIRVEFDWKPPPCAVAVSPVFHPLL